MSRIGTVRRLQALAAIGWTRPQVAEAMGVGCWLLSRATFGRGDVDRRRAREVYESLRGGPAHPGRHYRADAQTHGWNPPEAWDECDIDDAKAHPWDSLAVSWWAALPILHGDALVAHVARRLGWESSSAARIAETAGYGSVGRCAAVLARCRRADLGRALLARQSVAEAREAMAA